jgi:hypothetical protein
MIKLNSRSILFSVKFITLVQNLNREINLTFKWKHSNLLKIASVILISNCKKELFTANHSAQPLKSARGLLLMPAWALGPTANGWAAEMAQRRYPPGLLSAHLGGRLLTAVDLKIDGSPFTRRFCCGI